METSFARYCPTVQRRIEDHCYVGVMTRDIPDPLAGDLNGIEIHIDCAVIPEQRLFSLAHLFGHTVQWNVAPAAFELGRQYKPPADQRVFPQIIAYEGEAASCRLSLLLEVEIHEIDS